MFRETSNASCCIIGDLLIRMNLILFFFTTENAFKDILVLIFKKPAKTGKLSF